LRDDAAFVIVDIDANNIPVIVIQRALELSL
jgi:hypothetical protein